MDEIKLPKDVKFKSINIKNNVQVNSKTQINQSVNFQEVLSNTGGVRGLSSSTGTTNINIGTESVISLKPNQEAKASDSNKPEKTLVEPEPKEAKVKTESYLKTSLFSDFIPQRPVKVKNQPDSGINTKYKKKYDTVEQEEMGSENTGKYSSRISARLAEAKESKGKFAPNKYYEGSSYKDKFVRESEVEETFSEGVITGDVEQQTEEEIVVRLPEKPETEANKKDKDPEQRKKRNFIDQYKTKKTEEAFTTQVEGLIKQYGLNKSWMNLAQAPQTASFDDWIKSLIFGASTKELSEKDVNEISNYVTVADKLHQTEKDIIEELLRQIFQQKVTEIYPDMLSRMDKKSVDMMLRLFPSTFLKGIVKKFSEDKKDATPSKVVYKILNGLMVEPEEADHVTQYFASDFEEDDLKVLKKVFQGYYGHFDPEKTYQLIARMKRKGYLFPGFSGCLQSLFLDLYENNQLDKSKQVLRFLEKYAFEQRFNKTEAQALSYLITKKHFNLKVVNHQKVRDIFTKLIVGDKVEFISLEILSKLADKNPLSYIPARIDPEIRDFLRYMPFNGNEAGTYSEEDAVVRENFIFIGRLKLYGLDYKFKLQIILKDFFNDELVTIETDEDNFFMEKIPNGKYSVDSINFIYEEGSFPVEFADPKHLELLNFNSSTPNELFYFGSLKIFFSGEEQKYLSSIKLKNDYQEFSQFVKQKGNFYIKNQKVKINPTLYK